MTLNFSCNQQQEISPAYIYYRIIACNNTLWEMIRQTLPVAGRVQEPGWHHSGRGTLPPLDLVDSETQLSFTTKASESLEENFFWHENILQTLTGLHLSGQDVHRHLVSLGSVNHQPILSDRQESWWVRDRTRHAGIQHLFWSAGKELVRLKQLKTAKITGNISHQHQRHNSYRSSFGKCQLDAFSGPIVLL